MESTTAIERVRAEDNPGPQVHLDCVFAVCNAAGDRAGPVFGVGPSSMELALGRLTRECACGAGAHVEAPAKKGD